MGCMDARLLLPAEPLNTAGQLLLSVQHLFYISVDRSVVLDHSVGYGHAAAMLDPQAQMGRAPKHGERI